MDDDIDLYRHGETQGDPVILSEFLPADDQGEALSNSTSGPKDPIKVALLAVASSDPLCILGPELFKEASQKLHRQRNTRELNEASGMLVATLDEKWHYFYRDPKARARYIFACLMGLTWPSTHDDLEKRRLYQRFEDGWLSGDFEFLSSVPWEDLELYRESQAPLTTV